MDSGRIARDNQNLQSENKSPNLKHFPQIAKKHLTTPKIFGILTPTTKGDKMKEFRFVVEFEDGNCDFRTAKGNTEEEAAINLSKVLIKQHESKMIKGKKALRIEVQL